MTWSRPTRLKAFSRAVTPCISWAWIMAMSTSFMVMRRLALGNALAREPVGDAQDGAQVVGRMAPLGGEPGVVEIEEAHQAADVPGGLDRVQLVGRAGHPGAAGQLAPGTTGPSSLVHSG